MNSIWNVDLHSHTRWSKDCLSEFETIIRLCQQRGIDRIAITDHNTADGAIAMQKLAPELVIVGEEIMTTEGEILAYFVRESIPAGLTPVETIKRLRDQDAVISVSHPFDRLRKGAWGVEALDRIRDLVDAVEIFNARCLYQDDNQQAFDYAAKYHLRGTAGSDAHSRPEYGQAMTQLQPFTDAKSFLEALNSATYVKRLSPAYVHGLSTLSKWTKKLGLKKRLWAGG
ncbi:MAG: PHP domain-containing protein [Chloroflexi bacterium]|nr:PHP domain-containing protein [Chloroflexota bacterium]MCC6893575.1 PHP domain-containing protein [Anaerolineae bacterium]